MYRQLSEVAIVLTLLFLEEAGLPLPVAPGEAVLIGAGLLIASGVVPIWLMAPLAYLAVVGGVVTGYAWAHRIGPERVHALATKFHAGGPYDRAAARLRSATPLQIAISRLLPGLRVYTSLVAGAVNVNFGRFMTGVLPASAMWVMTFMGLGLFVGAPVERLLGRFEAYGLRALVVAVVVFVWVMAARLMPAAERPATDEPPRRKRRVAGAFCLDLGAVICMTAALSIAAGLAPVDVPERAALAAMVAVLGVTYLFVARQTVGYTVGEALLDVRYYGPRRPRLRRAV